MLLDWGEHKRIARQDCLWPYFPPCRTGDAHRQSMHDSPNRVRDSSVPAKMSLVRVNVYYSGRVQGVGFRYTVKSLVTGYDVLGTIRNLPDGRVELAAEGERAELEEFLQAVQDS